MGLVDSGGLSHNVGLNLTVRQRVADARREGPIAGVAEDLRDTCAALSLCVPNKNAGLGRRR